MHIRPPQKNRNNRNKSGRKPMGNVQNRVFESAGPEGKVRGTPQQIIEKYLLLARDAQTSGDRVMAENFLQHAEHYIRVLSASQAQNDERRQQGFGMGQRADFDDADEDGDEDEATDRQLQQPQSQPQHQNGERVNGERRNDDRRHEDRRRDERRDEERRDDRRGESPRADARRDDDRRQDDRRHEDRARVEAESAPSPEPEPLASALETIDARDDSDVGLVVTPESREEAPAKKAGEGRRRRRRPAAEASADEVPAVDEAQAG